MQRATLAEKEVSALKEQLAVANQPHDSQKVSAPNSDDLTQHRPSLEIELSAKDKEVSLQQTLYLILYYTKEFQNGGC